MHSLGLSFDVGALVYKYFHFDYIMKKFMFFLPASITLTLEKTVWVNSGVESSKKIKNNQENILL